MVKNNKFKKPPLTKAEKDVLAEKFIQNSDSIAGDVQKEYVAHVTKGLIKQAIKPLYLRAPESYWNDIQEIMRLTGLTMNAVCLELLRPVIKKKLKELKEE